MKKFYVTTPIYYVNDRPHIGHAYTTIAADVLARWKRLKREPVFFLTGTDEHGSKIAQAAEKHGASPEDYVDRLAGEFKSSWKGLNISNDDFIRTSEKRHADVVRSVFNVLHEKGEIVKGFYEDWYCVSDESFWLLSELADGKCPSCGRAVEKLKEETYFFKLSNYENKLLDHYEKNPEFLSPPKRAKEIINFVRSGLRDLSVSRLKEKWGIPLPFDGRHTAYVWFDALLNYLTAAGYDPRDNRGNFETLWPADVHLVGKEIFRFHAVIWPAMLMALGLPLPKKVFAHGWWTVEGEKMSKSMGNFVDPGDITKDFGVDALRYFLLREIPFGADGDFSRDSLVARYNAELANNLGNLFSRTLTLIEKNFGGVLKTRPEGVLREKIREQTEKMVRAYERIAFSEILESLNLIVTETNRYIDQKAPWNLVKSDLDQAERALSECQPILRWLSAGFYPFMPASSAIMWKQIGEETDLLKEGWKILQDPLAGFSPGKKLRKGAILFQRKGR